MDTSSEILPIISITPWLPSQANSPNNASERARVAHELHEACLVYGFFYLDVTGFALKAETDELESLARQFFALDQKTKDEISISEGDHARGASGSTTFEMVHIVRLRAYRKLTVHAGYQRLYENITLGKADRSTFISLVSKLHPLCCSGTGSTKLSDSSPLVTRVSISTRPSLIPIRLDLSGEKTNGLRRALFQISVLHTRSGCVA
jgi:isopenicillin N synthase-like dioxygenase